MWKQATKEFMQESKNTPNKKDTQNTPSTLQYVKQRRKESLLPHRSWRDEYPGRRGSRHLRASHLESREEKRGEEGRGKESLHSLINQLLGLCVGHRGCSSRRTKKTSSAQPIKGKAKQTKLANSQKGIEWINPPPKIKSLLSLWRREKRKFKN